MMNEFEMLGRLYATYLQSQEQAQKTVKDLENKLDKVNKELGVKDNVIRQMREENEAKSAGVSS